MPCSGILVSIACAVIGTFVVLRGLAFIGDALAHGVLPGIAAAIFLGLPGMIGAAVGAVVMIGGVSLVTHRSRLSSDTAIGLLFVAMLALGVVIVSASDAFQGDLLAILFGQILGTSTDQLLVMAIATAWSSPSRRSPRPTVPAAQLRPRTGRRCRLSLAPLPHADDAARGADRRRGLPDRGYAARLRHAPGSRCDGALLAHRIGLMMVIGGMIGSVSTYVGLLISYWFDFAASATIVLVAVSTFFVVLAFSTLRASNGHVTTTDAAGETLS